MTARIVIGACVVGLANYYAGATSYSLGVDVGFILAAWLVLVLVVGDPAPSRSERARAKARARVRRLEARDLRDWARLIDADTFDPGDLSPGAIVLSLQGAADALEQDDPTLSRYARRP